MYSLILTLVLLRPMSFLSNNVYWVCEVRRQAGKTFDDLYDVCTANKQDITIILAAFAGILTRTKFQLLVEDLQTESYAQARHIAKEQIEKKKLIKGYTVAKKARGSEREIKKLETVGQKIFAYCPGLDAVLELGRTSEDANAEATRAIVLEANAVATKQLREGQQQQAKKIEKKVVEAATDIRVGVGKVLVETAEVLVADGRDNKNEIKETVNQRADQQMAFNAKMQQEMEQARLDREEAKRERLEAKRERMALTLQMKRMNRLLVQHAADQPLPELESEQLALEYQDSGAEPVLTSPHGPSYERLVEPPSAGSDTLGVTPRTESMDVRRALAPKFSLFGNEQLSPASPESPQEAVAPAALDDTIVAEAPPQEAAALSPVDAPPLADIASPAPAPAAEDDLHVASPQGGVDATAALFTPLPPAQPASGSSDLMLEDVRDAETWQKLGDMEPELASALKSRAKQREAGTYISPGEQKKKNPNYTPGKLLKPSPDDPEPSKKSEKKKKKNKFFPWA